MTTAAHQPIDKRRRLHSRAYYRRQRMIFRGVGHIATAILLLVMLMPFIWMLLTSIKQPVEALAYPPTFIPQNPTLDNYQEALKITSIERFFLNTAIVATVSTLLAVIIGSAAAYSLARVKFPLKINTIIAMWILVTRMYPAIATALPYFVLIRDLDLLDTRWALIVTYTSFNLPFVVWLMVSFYQGIPLDLEKAAIMDGCSMWQRFTLIVLPLAVPGIVATFILSFILGWNEFLFATILTSLDAKTVPVVMSGFITDRGLDWGPMSALGTMLVMPVIILAWVAQGYLVRGLTMGAVKE